MQDRLIQESAEAGHAKAQRPHAQEEQAQEERAPAFVGAARLAADPSSSTVPPTSLDAAIARLELALGALETASGRRLEAARSQSDLNEALGAMQDDRARLALDLDEALARGRRLERAVDEAASRLDETAAALIALANPAQGRAIADCLGHNAGARSLDEQADGAFVHSALLKRD